jgi:hypothetical protein
MNRMKKYGDSQLVFGTIEAASCGDADALRAVVKHYEGYILALSVVRLYTEDGIPHLFVDETLQRELELRLITKVIGFRFKAA